MKLPPNFRPMKASKIKHLDELKPCYPLLATPKLDGIRCVTFEPIVQLDLFSKKQCQAYSLSLEQIPNNFIQETLRGYGGTGLDGELITYDTGKMDKYNPVQSKVMSRDGKPDFVFHVFDLVMPLPYWERMRILKDELDWTDCPRLQKCLPKMIKDEEALLAYESKMLEQGYEGVMLRHIDGPYKFGRSTPREGYLWKLKRFLDAEATIIGFEEQMHNGNEATIGNTGLMERTDHKANLTPMGMLGALIVNGHNGIEFKIGTGFDHATRTAIWQNQDAYKFKVVKYKYQPHGVKTAPRCPVFLGMRDGKDMNEN